MCIAIVALWWYNYMTLLHNDNYSIDRDRNSERTHIANDIRWWHSCSPVGRCGWNFDRESMITNSNRTVSTAQKCLANLCASIDLHTQRTRVAEQVRGAVGGAVFPHGPQRRVGVSVVPRWGRVGDRGGRESDSSGCSATHRPQVFKLEKWHTCCWEPFLFTENQTLMAATYVSLFHTISCGWIKIKWGSFNKHYEFAWLIV